MHVFNLPCLIKSPLQCFCLFVWSLPWLYQYGIWFLGEDNVISLSFLVRHFCLLLCCLTPLSPSFQQPHRFIIIVIYDITSVAIIHSLLSNFLDTHCWILLKHPYLSKCPDLICNWIRGPPGCNLVQKRSFLKLNTQIRRYPLHNAIWEKLG